MIQGLASIIIVNWNGRDYIAECVESALDQSYENRELVIVDNGSTDGSRDWLRARSDRYTLIESATNTGFAGGVNTGIRVAQGEFIALLNNDAVADRDWLSSLIAAACDPGVGMVASKILFYEQRQVIDKVGHFLYPDGLNRGRGAGETDHGQFDRPGGILFPDGCAALYRKSMLDDIGLFDEQFFAYGDDADLGLRARWRGWNCLYAPGARVYHRHSRSLGKYSAHKAFLVERNRFWVAVKLLPWPLLLISPLYTLWRFCWHIASIISKQGLAGRVAGEQSAWRLFCALLRAYASGCRGLKTILRKRREVFRRRSISDSDFYDLLRKYRITARELALRD